MKENKNNTLVNNMNIISLSGGKDSTAMLLMMLEKNYRIDEIIFCDTTVEFPEMYRHLDKLEQYIDMKITRLKQQHDFEYMMFNYVKKKGKNKGKQGYSWADFRNRWCTKYFKQQPFRKHIKDKYKKTNVNIYIGIAADEPKRIKNDIYPLVEWGVTEKEALAYCYSKGFDWDGLYEKFDRVSCWCCPLKNLNELRNLRKFFPNLWEKLREMDTQTYRRFRTDYSVEELEEKFSTEEKQLKLCN